MHKYYIGECLCLGSEIMEITLLRILCVLRN